MFSYSRSERIGTTRDASRCSSDRHSARRSHRPTKIRVGGVSDRGVLRSARRLRERPFQPVEVGHIASQGVLFTPNSRGLGTLIQKLGSAFPCRNVVTAT